MTEQMTEQVIEEKQSTWTESYGMTFDEVPVAPYIDPEYFELEKEHIFRRSWINVGREDEISKPGSYSVKNIELLGISVLLTKTVSGEIKAFHNVCRHRCNKLVMSGAKQCGRARGFKCEFHGWTYNLDGRLTSVTDEESFAPLDPEKFSLTPISVDVWRGFIFICAHDPVPHTLSEQLGDWGKAIAPFPFESYGPIFEWNVVLDCNWKTLQDAFAETYHAVGLHKISAYDSVATADNPNVHLLNVEIFPESGHRCISLPANLEYQLPPTKILAASQFPYDLFGHELESPADTKGMNRLGSKNWSFDINICFPNMELLLGQGWYIHYIYTPISVNKTRFYHFLLFASRHKCGGENCGGKSYGSL